MTMLGMQADMQCHYFPSYFSTRDVNLNASCSSIWPSSHADKIVMNGHYYNGNPTLPFPDQYSAYKDEFKRTILQHEAIFKSQVRELHRLYNRQRELMVEMKRIELGGQRLQMEKSNSNQIFSETSFEYKKACIVSAIPWLNPTHGQSSVPFAENKQSHDVPCVQGNMMLAGSGIVQTEGHRKESELLESNCKKIGKKILDLELPAYMYIDSEPEESFAEEINPSEMLSSSKKSFVESLQKNDVEPCHAIDDASFTSRTKCFADLNEPIKLEEESDSEYNGFLHPVPGHVEIQQQDLPGIGNSQLQFEAQVIQNSKTREDPQSSPDVILLDMNEDQQECIYDIGSDEVDNDKDTGRVCQISPSHMLDVNNGNLVTKSEYECGSSSVSSFREHKRNLVRTPIVQALPCLKRSVPVSGISKQRSHQQAGNNSCPAINLESEPDYSNKKRIKSSMDSVLTRDIDLNCISPCYAPDVEENFKGFTHDDKLSKKLDLDCNSMPDSREQINAIDLNSVSRPDEKSSGSKFNVDLNSFIDEDDSLPLPSPSTEVDLHAPESPENKERFPPRGDSEENQLDIPCEVSMLENGKPEENLVIMAEPSPPRGDSEENQLAIPCEVSMLENGKPEENFVTMAEPSPPRGDLDANQLDIPCEVSMLENGKPEENLVTTAEPSPPRGDLDGNQLDIPCELSMLENGKPEEDLVTIAEGPPSRGDSNENQLDIPCALSMPENGKPEEDLVTMAEQSPLRGDSVENQLDIPCELSMLEIEKPEDLLTMAEQSPPRGDSDEKHLDIPCVLSTLENGKPEEVLVTMAERPSPRGGSNENQLDIPCALSMPESEKPEEDRLTMAERSPSRGDSDENQLDIPCELSMPENEKPEEDPLKMAAEAIVSISSSEAQNHLGSATPGPYEAPKGDSLFWFAKLASSAEDDPESEFGVVLSCKNFDHHKECSEIDYFEAMTLQLEETKAEEYCCKSSTQKEAACPASLPRRGRTQRARQQRKDFQSEILPSLASLSRYEVTEDLQAIGGLIESAHCSSGATRIGRNGLRRGRSAKAALPSKTETETPPCVALDKQSGHKECSVEEKNLIDWGKITRRRRGQRCPANNPRLITSQV